MNAKAQILHQANRLRSHFESAGAQYVDLPILQPADTLLDLYGEDIRARAYTTHDPIRGEQMLRPDFTVPVVQMHMQSGATPARYTYLGEVFRKQEEDPSRANEYIQVGFELFDRTDIAARDAEVFALFNAALGAAPLQAQTGDIGLLMAAVRGLETTHRRKEALMRHIWRPAKFRSLLDRYAAQSSERYREFAPTDAPIIGLRSEAEIAERVAWVQADADAAPISAEELAFLDRLLGVDAPYWEAIELLEELASAWPTIADAVALAAARGAKLQAQGIDVANLPFSTSFGRSTMEYYDGFVFGFYAKGRDDLPFAASGGRYDTLTRHLGRSQDIPAIGGIIRPVVLLELERQP